MSEQLRTLPLWLPSYLRQPPARLPDGVKDVMLCVCDHFEPLHRADKAEARRRMAAWKTEFPKNIAPFRDADGVRPRHTCFYPIEQYDPDLLDDCAELCRASGAEVEVHLHHDRDTEATLRARLEEHVERIDTDLALEYQMAQGLAAGGGRDELRLAPLTVRHGHGPELHAASAVLKLVTGFR